jgi:NADPH:quinone reductase-like Zn-dependent oxidoreductase
MVQAPGIAKDLEQLWTLIGAGRLGPGIDRRYRFAELPAAIADPEQGRARAKIVAEVA